MDDAQGLIHTIADPDSTSAMPCFSFNMVERVGLVPEEFFGTVPLSGSHEATLSCVFNGTSDTAATYQDNEANGVYQRMEDKSAIAAGEIFKICDSA
ncbi:PhnD/SsuA/transferrin family substrate-binding protein [Jannaschia seohaensis]|uniref:Phosphonate transport system substrate-binding protein n=1 Tax=Jannaschia seohaensis TaxID=475081 RepID=A0A2Y9ARD5_9RHOB|nr:PhnD/SsuA/transferrin family substrate-binding protein [Jannaschia seohaensis]PWJ18121.1 phosphonate transport system substrate-binding protein [Jannaschia seohaensis]SSA46646.1 phosphonate transport system substrate-binding protein [Jannaschia seohaensis]